MVQHFPPPSLSLAAFSAASSAAAVLGIIPSSIPALPVVTTTPTTTSTLSATANTVLASTGECSTPTTALALMLNSLTGNIPHAAKDRVFISSGLPTVPKQLLEKIQRWEYIDLVELLPAPTVYDEMVNAPAKFTFFPGCEILRPKRRQIESIVDWVKAFTVYCAALLQKHPEQRNELLAYQLTIIKASQQYDGLQWRAYDTHFRVSAAATGSKSWSKLDTDLYTRFFTGRAKLVSTCSSCDSTQHTHWHCPKQGNWENSQLTQQVPHGERNEGSGIQTCVPSSTLWAVAALG